MILVAVQEGFFFAAATDACWQPCFLCRCIARASWGTMRPMASRLPMQVGPLLCLGLVSFWAGVFLAGCAPPSASTSPDTAPDALETGSNTAQSNNSGGDTLFQTYCAGCHPNGGNSANPAKPVAGSSKLISLETFTGYVRRPAPAMPSFSPDLLSDTDLKQLHLYVQTLTP
jgi:cytochrome c6